MKIITEVNRNQHVHEYPSSKVPEIPDVVYREDNAESDGCRLASVTHMIGGKMP